MLAQLANSSLAPPFEGCLALQAMGGMPLFLLFPLLVMLPCLNAMCCHVLACWVQPPKPLSNQLLPTNPRARLRGLAVVCRGSSAVSMGFVIFILGWIVQTVVVFGYPYTPGKPGLRGIMPACHLNLLLLLLVAV
jgi:hypothetical protein